MLESENHPVLRERTHFDADTFCALSISLSLFFSQYNFFVTGISCADVLLAISCILILFRKPNITVKREYGILFFYFICMLLSLFSATRNNSSFVLVSFSKVVSRWIRYFIYAFFIFVLTNECMRNLRMRDRVFSIYRFFCYAFSLYALLQCVTYLLTGYMLPINILPFAWSRETSTESIVEFSQTSYFRVFGPFMEPGYLSKFILSGLTLSFLGWRNNKVEFYDKLFFLIILIVLLISTSLQGIFIGLFSLLAIMFVQKKTNPLILLIFTLISFLLFYLFLSLDFFSVPRDRFNALLEGESYGYSSNMRIYRGFALWWQIDFISKITGVGLGNIANYVFNSDIYTIFDHPNRDANYLEYVNALSGILVSSGLIGFFFIIGYFAKKFKQLDSLGKILLLQFILVLLSGSGFFSVGSVFFLSIISLNMKESVDEQTTKDLSPLS